MAKAKKRKPTKKRPIVRKKLKRKILRRAQDHRPARRRRILVSKRKAKKVLKRKVSGKTVAAKRKISRKKIKKIKRPVRKIVRKNKAKKISRKILRKKIAQRKVVKRAVKKSKPKKIIAHKTKEPAENFQAEALFRAKIKVVGVGGGGGSIVSEIGRSLEKATFVIADTDIRALKKRSGIKYFWFGQELTHGLGTGVNVDLAKQAAEQAKEKIGQFFKDQDIVIFVASLGGGLGSGATQVFAEVARDFGGITVGIFTMPFKFEGKNKYRIAQSALKALRSSLNVSLVIPNERIFRIIDASTPITTAFSTVNKNLIESLESLIDLIYNPGIINIDFADLRTILKGRGNNAFLNTIEASGKNRVEKICENVFKNSLLQNTGFKAEKILFNIAGAENLPMFEVEKISSHIATVNPEAKIIFGISKNSKLKNRIKTTILMTGGSSESQMQEEPEKKETPKKLEAKEDAVKKESKPKFKKPKNPAKKSKEKIIFKKPEVLVPAFQIPAPLIPVLEQRKIDIVQAGSESVKKTIRRSGLEIRKQEELAEKKRQAQEKEWEIPAFLRKIKFGK